MKITYPTANPLAPVSARTASSPDAIRVCVGRTSSEVPIVTGTEQNGGGKEDDNEIMLGRTMLLEETIPEDLVLLLHHLVCLSFSPEGPLRGGLTSQGPRYRGNFQEAAGRFLTCKLRSKESAQN